MPIIARVLQVNNSLPTVKVTKVNNAYVPIQQDTITIQTNLPSGGSPVTRLDQLVDVVEGTPANNATLVYNSTTDKYDVKQINLDGGTF